MEQIKVQAYITQEMIELGFVDEKYDEQILYYIGIAYAAGLDEGWKGGAGPSNRKKVVQYTMSGNKVAIHESARVAARKAGLSHTVICRAARGEAKTSGGYKWKYLEDEKDSSES